jgi:uncharacterized SAM-binding protein YcdF (DUF218 family)
VTPKLAVVVPGHSHRHRISRTCRRLVAEAEALAARWPPDVVVFSGWSPGGGLSEAEQMRLLWSGPDAELVVEPTAQTTAQNAARTLPLLLEREVGRAIVVCAPLHRFRVRSFFCGLYEAAGIETSIHVARMPPTPFALAWELGALTVRSRQLREAEAEVAEHR